MEAVIINFLGCQQASVEANKIALITGLNGQGKTSILTAIAVTLSGTLPSGLAKTQSGMLIHAGAVEAKVALSQDGCLVTNCYPEGRRVSTGANAPHASQIATGTKFSQLKFDERVALLERCYRQDITRAILAAAAKNPAISPGALEILKQTLIAQGPASAEELYQERARALKAQWRVMTGETYGEVKANLWRPTGWNDGLASADELGLMGTLNVYREKLQEITIKAATARMVCPSCGYPYVTDERSPEELFRDVQRAKEKVQQQEAKLAAWQQYHKVSQILSQLNETKAIAKMLSPTGEARTKALTDVLADFNDKLSEAGHLASWSTATLHDNLTIHYAGRPYPLLSESEKFRTDTLLQVVIATLDHSSAVIIDGADILDLPSRAGLFTLLAQQPFESFVGVTTSKPDSAPNLKALGCGTNYWVKDGICREI